MAHYKCMMADGETADYMSAADFHDFELVMRMLLHYTDEQIAEVWDKQIIPNTIIGGVRVAAHWQGVTYIEHLLAEHSWKRQYGYAAIDHLIEEARRKQREQLAERRGVAHDVEIILRRMFDYTDEQIAEVWGRQLIPNQVIDGQRAADFADARVFLERLWDKRRAVNDYGAIFNRAYQNSKRSDQP